MRNQQDKCRHWLDAGKQIGKIFSYEQDKETCWSAVGIQKWAGEYKIYVSDIKELHMSMAEEYLLEEVVTTTRFEEIPQLLASKTIIKLEELTPLKGQRVFNPKFD
jgi:hypothetical protein